MISVPGFVSDLDFIPFFSPIIATHNALKVGQLKKKGHIYLKHNICNNACSHLGVITQCLLLAHL